MNALLTTPMLQPKLMVANYVAQQGFAVPTIYSSFSEAVASGEPFIARSEHPQDFAGSSGLLSSHVLSPEIIDETRSGVGLREKLQIFHRRLAGGSDRALELDLANFNPFKLDKYCRLLGIDRDDFLNDVSYSYWKHLGGYNQTIVGDNAVAGRYHVFTTAGEDRDQGFSYSILDRGGVVRWFGDGIDEDMIARSAATFVQYYESLRQLPAFKTDHYPIIESQWLDGINYFLQYHIGRDVDLARFELSREPEDGEMEAILVRGATPPEGQVVNAAIFYPTDESAISEHEEASFDFANSGVITEIMTRRRDAQFIQAESFDKFARSVAFPHLSRSSLFKPGISGVINFVDFVGDELATEAWQATKRDGIPFRFPIRIISDGRRAFFKIIR